MLKKRIIPSILVCKGRVVTSQQFNPWRTVGSIAQYIRLQVQRECDELMVCSIGSSDDSISQRMMHTIASNANIPITVIGNINSLDKAESLLKNGADRIGICSSIYNNINLLTGMVSKLGRQSVVVDVPFIYNKSRSAYMVWDWKSKQCISDLGPYLDLISSKRPGEIILTSVENDGSMAGMCIDVIKAITTDIPLVLRGGAGSSQHLLEALKGTNIAAVAASSIFSFSDVTPATMRNYLQENKIPVRDTRPFSSISSQELHL